MKKAFAFLTLTFMVSCAFALPSFPGAEGFGGQTPGGRGGKVLIVTNTNATGAGSFQAALTTSGPRIIVFRTSGLITLPDQILLESANYSFVTIAGQTSPGGITITSTLNTPIWQYTGSQFHDAAWRFLRFRVKTANNDHSWENYKSYNWIVDHCDFSGGTDECFDACYVHDVTIQWSTVSNSGPTGQVYGTLMAYDPVYNISYHHNLWANHNHRAPLIHWGGTKVTNKGLVDYRNNVCYNIASGHTFTVETVTGTDPININVVGNVIKDGPVNTDHYAPLWFGAGVSVHETNTVVKNCPYRSQATWADSVFDTRYGRNITRMPTPYAAAAVTTETADQAFESVLTKVGAWPRDAMNTRTVGEVRNGTGGLGKVDDALLTSGPAAPADVDNDGMSDSWETAAGLNPADATDNIKDRDGDGYTNIEEYINCVADSLLGNPCPPPQAVESSGKFRSNNVELSLSPNPYSGTGAFQIACNGKQGGAVRILDASGRIIAGFDAKAGTLWSPRTAKGERIPAGVYLVRWEKDNRTISQKKVIILR